MKTVVILGALPHSIIRESEDGLPPNILTTILKRSARLRIRLSIEVTLQTMSRTQNEKVCVYRFVYYHRQEVDIHLLRLCVRLRSWN
jgi:hypothetical protein